MSHCEKCIHYNVCERYHTALSFFPDNEDCKVFKPNADVVEVKHGEWTTNSDYPDRLICNKCRYKEDMWWADTGTKYCPNCGADMKGGAE